MNSLWKIVTDLKTHVMIDREVFDIFKDTELCKEFQANGWETEGGYCLSQKNFFLLKKIYGTTQEIKMLNRRIFNSHQKTLGRPSKGRSFTVKDEQGSLYYINDQNDSGFFNFHQVGNNRDFCKPFEENIMNLHQLSEKMYKEEMVKQEGEKQMSTALVSGKKNTNNRQGTRNGSGPIEPESNSPIETEFQLLNLENPQNYVDINGHKRGQNRPRFSDSLIEESSPPRIASHKNKRFCRIDSSPVSNRHEEQGEYQASIQNIQNVVENELNPFVKVRVDLNQPRGLIPDYASVEKISHEEDEENESSTKKFLRMKQKMDSELPVPGIMGNNIMFPPTISVGDSVMSQSNGDIYAQMLSARQPKVNRGKIKKKRIGQGRLSGPGSGGNSHRKTHVRQVTENLSEYRKLLDEAQKLLSNVDQENENQGEEILGSNHQGIGKSIVVEGKQNFFVLKF